MRGWNSLLVFLFLVTVAAGLGAMNAPDGWFAALAKPGFNPPGWVFAPAWTALYFLMAVAAWRVHRASGIGPAIVIWTIQLMANAIWSPLFFGLHRIDLALIDILVLDLLVAATTILFYRRDRLAAWLMTPYLAWIGFATALNVSLWKLN